jgi:hypothetical protein
MDTTTDAASISLLERAFEPGKVDDQRPLRLLLTLKERATPIVRSRPSSVHMESVWFKRTLWETRNTARENHAEAQFIIAGRREPSERSASY